MITRYCERLGFPLPATKVLTDAFETIQHKESLRLLLQAAVEDLFVPESSEWQNAMETLSSHSGIARETADMVLLLAAIKPLSDRYAAAGLEEALLWETMEDLRYKLEECRAVRGVWGTFVAAWLRGYYLLKRFKLGRMQYETVPLKLKQYHGFQQGDPIVNCHIPSSGPLTMEAVMDSLKRAYGFFEQNRKDGLMLVTCVSWLLYPPHARQVYPDGSNMQKFYDLFHVVGSQEDKSNTDFWRVFHRDYAPENMKHVPLDTSLRRRLYSFLRQGNSMGFGFGVLLFDGEKIAKPPHLEYRIY